jgi:hypothetical protein
MVKGKPEPGERADYHSLFVSAGVVSLRAAWTRIAVRVAGSWVAAVGMLMFGWLVRGTS